MIPNRQFIIFYFSLPTNSIFNWWLRKANKLFRIFSDYLTLETSLEIIEKYDGFFDHLSGLNTLVSLSRSIGTLLRIIIWYLVVTFFLSKTAWTHFWWFVYIKELYKLFSIWDYILRWFIQHKNSWRIAFINSLYVLYLLYIFH